MRVRPALARITPVDLYPDGCGVARRIETEPDTRSEPMANTPQSKKRARQNDKRQAVNKARRSRIRTFLRKVEEAIASGDKDSAVAALRAAQPELMRGVTRGVFHKNTASRKMSRLSARVKALG
jgi:small subunit ribosomal protein S20